MIPGIVAGAAVPPPRYLDELAITPQAVWSLRKLVSTATVAMRVRRSSDNTEQDIGFDGDALDTTTLGAFVGGGNGYVVTWYDQTGNGKHLTNATPGQQPTLVNAGAYQGEVTWDGVDDRLRAAAVTMGTPHLGIYARMRQANSTANKVILDTTDANALAFGAKLYLGSSNNPGSWFLQGRNAASETCQLRYAPSNVATAMPVTALYDRGLSQLSEMKLWHNGIAQPVLSTFGADMSGSFASNDVVIGAHGDGTLPCDCAIVSLALYNADTSALRPSIEGIVAV